MNILKLIAHIRIMKKKKLSFIISFIIICFVFVGSILLLSGGNVSNLKNSFVNDYEILKYNFSQNPFKSVANISEESNNVFNEENVSNNSDLINDTNSHQGNTNQETPTNDDNITNNEINNQNDINNNQNDVNYQENNENINNNNDFVDNNTINDGSLSNMENTQNNEINNDTNSQQDNIVNNDTNSQQDNVIDNNTNYEQDNVTHNATNDIDNNINNQEDSSLNENQNIDNSNTQNYQEDIDKENGFSSNIDIPENNFIDNNESDSNINSFDSENDNNLVIDNNENTNSPYYKLKLSHTEEKEFDADCFQINFGINEKCDSLVDCLSNIDNKLQDLKNKLSISSSVLEVESNYYSCYPELDCGKVMYNCYKNFKITNCNSSNLNDILRELETISPSYISSPEYKLSDERNARQQVLLDAINKIKEKANLLDNNAKLVKLEENNTIICSKNGKVVVKTTVTGVFESKYQ